MKIHKIGLNYSHNKNFLVERPNGSGDYLFLFLKTPAVFYFNGIEQIASKNSIIIFDMNSPQYYRACQDSYVNDFIHFEADQEPELHSIPLNTLFMLPSTKQVPLLIKEIYLEYISANSRREESIDLYLRLLFIKITEFISSKLKDRIHFEYYDTLLSIRSMIYRHPDTKYTISDLSKAANLSVSHFQRLYHKTFGVTCIADVIVSKIAYAKTSLSDTGLTIKEIAAGCGYHNVEHFMRQFKKETGLTPTQYRKQTKYC